MKVTFEVFEGERRTYTVTLPDGMDPTQWSADRFQALGDAAIRANYQDPDPLEALAPGALLHVEDIEADSSVDSWEVTP